MSMNTTNMMNIGTIKRAFFVMALLLLLPGAFADANTVVRTGDTIEISDDQLVEGDLYVAAQTFINSGEITADEVIVAGTYTSNGRVGADSLILAGTVQYNASTSDDLRVIGGDITISESIGGDVFVIGGVLKVLSTASIAGDIVFYGGEAELNGTVGGDVLGMSEQIRLDGSVAGDVDVTSASVIIGERAQITGNVRYISPQELIRSQAAVVEGEITRNELQTTDTSAGFDWGGLIMRFLILSFAALVLFLLFRRHLVRVVEEVRQHPGSAALLGGAFILAAPLVALILMLTVLGMVLGFFVLAAVLFFFTLGFLFTPIILGGLLSLAIKRQVQVDFIWILIGTAAFCLLTLIPIVNELLTLGLFVLGVGALLRLCYRALR